MEKNIDFDKFFVKSDLIPAIIQEKSTGEVLMLAYMNKESMKKTFETGYTWFWSRSRQELWNKGATSGNLQKVIDIHADCDDDTLLVKFSEIAMTILCLLRLSRQAQLVTQAIIPVFIHN